MKSFAYLLKFSYRNLFRVPKRTLIMILSLSFGCGFIIWDLNFANSGSKEIMKDFLTQYAGSITSPTQITMMLKIKNNLIAIKQ